MMQRKTKIQMITILSLSVFGLGGMMNHALKMHEQNKNRVTEYYSGIKPTTSFPLQSVFANLNPFQKNISKSVYVLEYVTNTYVPGSGINSLERGCLDQTTNSIRKKEFDELLLKGVKVTNSIPKKTEINVENYFYGQCVGTSYILEGPENLLNNP
jgi:hypothetical protein